MVGGIIRPGSREGGTLGWVVGARGSMGGRFEG
jgi:hypothetical protein